MNGQDVAGPERADSEICGCVVRAMLPNDLTLKIRGDMHSRPASNRHGHILE